jgi:hypothetical protein
MEAEVTDANIMPRDAGLPSTALVSARILAFVDRRRWWLFSAVALLYAAGFSGRWRVTPDNALYMELGRNVAEGRGFVYHGVRHNWYEPGLPYVIGLSFRWFGQENYVPLTLFVLACGLVSLVLTYHLFRLHAGRPTAVLLTVLLAVTETFYRYCFQIVTDTPFLVGILAFLVGYEAIVGRGDSLDARGHMTKRWWAWGLIILGTLVMCAFRPTIITFLGAVAVATLYHLVRGPARVRHVFIAVVTVASVVAFRAADPRRSTPGEAAHREATLKTLLTEKRGWALERMFTRFIPEMLSEHTPEAVFGVEFGPGIDQLLSSAVIALGLLLVKRRVLWGAWVAATVAQMAFWLPRERYFLPILPLLILAVWYAALWLERRLTQRAASVALAAVLLLLAVPNLLQDGTFIYEQRLRGVGATGARDPEAKGLMEMGRLVAATAGEDDVVLARAARELTYFSRRKVIAPPRSLRQPPSPRMEQRVREEVLAAPSVYAVMPDFDEKHVERFFSELGMELGPEVGRIEQEPWKGRPRPTLALHRLVRKGPVPGTKPANQTTGPPPAPSRPGTNPT